MRIQSALVLASAIGLGAPDASSSEFDPPAPELDAERGS
jgi:hypothetical protein